MQLWTAVRHFISANQELIAILGVLGTIGSTILALVLYRLAKPKKLLAYATRTFRIVREPNWKLPNLEISYNKSPVRSLSVTRVTIWNAGNESVRVTDLPRAHAPIISVPDGLNLFEADVIERTSVVNNFNLEPVYDPQIGYSLTFDFLDPGDGVVIHIVHEGTKLTDVRLSGELIGGRIRRTSAVGERFDAPDDSFPWSKPPDPQSGRAQTRFAARLLMILFPVIGFLLIITGARDAGIGLLSMGLLVGIGMLVLSRRIYPPASLKSYDDNLKVE